jgi:hypothetical protein
LVQGLAMTRAPLILLRQDPRTERRLATAFSVNIVIGQTTRLKVDISKQYAADITLIEHVDFYLTVSSLCVY